MKKRFLVLSLVMVLSLQASETLMKKQPQKTTFSDDCVVRSLSACSWCCCALAVGCCYLATDSCCAHLLNVTESGVESHAQAVALCGNMSLESFERRYHVLTWGVLCATCSLLSAACAYDYRDMRKNVPKVDKHK